MFKIIVIILFKMGRDLVKLLLRTDVDLARIISNVGKYSIEVHDNP